jgi:hypothetical protein
VRGQRADLAAVAVGPQSPDRYDYADPVEIKPVDEDAAVLLRAAEIIEERGWCQEYPDAAGRVCAGRAIMLALGLKSGWAGNEQERIVRHRLGFSAAWFLSGALANWNDAPGRTAAEVIDRLRSAARG